MTASSTATLPPRRPIYGVCHRLVLVKYKRSHLGKHLRKLRLGRGIMRCPQLRILALIIGALIHQSAGASFDCDLIDNVIKCEVEVVYPNDEFLYDSSKPPPQCSGDGKYCVEGMSIFQNEWDISISNNGMSCTAACTPISQYCDESGCKPYCSVDACWEVFLEPNWLRGEETWMKLTLLLCCICGLPETCKYMNWRLILTPARLPV